VWLLEGANLENAIKRKYNMSTSIINFDQNITMTSLDFLNSVINPAREEAGEKPLRNNDFIGRVKDELNGYENFVIELVTPAGGGRAMESINLNADQLLLVGMRESKAVRLKVLEYIRKIEAVKQRLEDDKKRVAVQSANRRGVTWGDFCKAHDLPAQRLLQALKKSRGLFRFRPDGRVEVNPRYRDYFIILKPTDRRFSPTGINFRFNAKGQEYFSNDKALEKFRTDLVEQLGSDYQKQQLLLSRARAGKPDEL